MLRHPLLLLLLLLVAAIAVGDCFLPYGLFQKPPHWSDEAVTRQGIVTRQPKATVRATRLVVRLPESDALVQLTVLGDTTSAAPAVAAGDLIAFHACIEVPHNAGNPGEVDYAAYLRHQGITGQAFCLPSDWQDLGRASNLKLHERMLIMRQRLVSAYAEHFDGEVLAIVSAMTLGDRSRVDHSLRELYNRCGASHILALSGMHLSLLVLLFSFIIVNPLRRLGDVGRCVGTSLMLLLLWTFVFLAGLPVSLVRAATMLTIVSLLQMLHRSAPPYHALSLTLIIMLLWTPALLFDIGLQLSALSVAAITFVARRFIHKPTASATDYLSEVILLPRRRRLENHLPRLTAFVERPSMKAIRRCIVSLFLFAIAAGLATFPLVAHYFGRIAPLGFLSSFFIIPTAYIVLCGALVFFAIPPLRGITAAGLSTIISAVHKIMEALGNVPMAMVDVTLSWWGVAGCYALLLWLAVCLQPHRTKAPFSAQHQQRWARRLRLAGIGGLLIIYIIGVETLPALLHRPAPHVAIYNRLGHPEVHCVTATTDSIVSDASPHKVGNVLLFAGQRVAIIDHALPFIADAGMPPPLPVDVLLIAHGAKGHLANMLMRYSPTLVALDGSLTDYYRRRFTDEATAAGMPFYDVGRQGALILPQPESEKK